MSRSYAASTLAREIVKLQQELVSLKAPQRYLTGQAKGYVSNRVRVTSRILSTESSYERRGILCNFLFTGDKPNKVVIPKIKFQLYSSSGNVISPTSDPSDGVWVHAINNMAGDNPNETEFAVEFLLTGSAGQTDAFYGDFWCVGNDTGILTLIGNLGEGR